MAVITPYQDPTKKVNEQLHNQPAPPVYPYVQEGQQLPMVKQPPAQTMQPQQDPQQMSGPMTRAPQGQPGISQTPGAIPQPIQQVGSNYQPTNLQQQLLETGQQAAIQGYQSPVTEQTSQLTQNLLRDPSLGTNREEIRQRQLAQYDVEAAQKLEEARRATAPISGSGQAIKGLHSLSLQQAQGKTLFADQLQQQEIDRKMEEYYRALAEGRAGSEMERLQQQANIGNIAQIIGAGEGEAQRQFSQSENAINRGLEIAMQSQNQDFQMALTELQGKINSGAQLTAQDFQSSMMQLDREHEAAMQAGNIQAAQELEQMRMAFSEQQAAIGREFMASQAGLDRLQQLDLQANDIEASQELAELQGKIQQGLQITNNDFIQTQNSLDRQLKEAMQSKDIEAQNKIIQAQLDLDRWKTEAGFEFTAEQNALNRGLELSLQSNDQGFQENMLNLKEKIDLNMMMTQNEWAGIQNDLNRQIQQEIAQGNWSNAEKLQQMQQDFATVQNDLDRKHDETLQNMIFEQDKWKQGRVEELTKLGWDHDTAMQLSEQEHQKYMQDFEWKKKELMQQGMQDFEAEQQAKQWAWQSNETSLDRQLQREIEAGRMTLEEKRLAQEASQFTDKLEFDKYALEKGLEQKDIDRIWNSKENALDRAWNMQLQEMQNEFNMTAMEFQSLMQNLQNMAPEQAGQVLKQLAVDSGITHELRITGNEIHDLLDQGGGIQSLLDMGIDEETANSMLNDYNEKSMPGNRVYSLTIPGLKNFNEFQQGMQKISSQLESIQGKLDANKQLTPEEYQIYKEHGTHTPMPFQDDVLYEYTYDARGSNDGKRAWRFKDDIWNWLNENKGSVFQGNDGEIYRIESFWEPGTSSDDKLKKAYVTIKNLGTGELTKWGGGGIGG